MSEPIHAALNVIAHFAVWFVGAFAALWLIALVIYYHDTTPEQRLQLRLKQEDDINRILQRLKRRRKDNDQ